MAFKIGDRVKLKWIADNVAGMSINERQYWTDAFPNFAGTVSRIDGESIVVDSDRAGHALTTDAQYIEKV